MRHRHPPGTALTVLAALLLICPAARPAAADSLTATLGQPLKEVSHRVDVRLKDGVASYRVRRTFHNAGKRHEEASLSINLPYGAAATGLRIRGKKQWFNGELMERDKAAALYRKLTGLGPHAPRDPALLHWVWTNEIHLQVFPVPPGKRATVEYTLTVPTRYNAGHYTLSYPRHGGRKNLAVPILRIYAAGKGRGRITVNGRRVARAQSIALRGAVRTELPGGVEPEEGASYTVSTLRLRRWDVVKSVTVGVDIRHTYRGDLRVELVTPGGVTHVLHSGTGGSANHLRQSYTVKLAPRTVLAGRWHLVVSDHARLDVGQLVAWSLRGRVGPRRFRYRARGLPRVLPDAPDGDADASQATIRFAPPRIGTLAGRLGRVVAASDIEFLRLELDTARRLRPLPRRLSVVFVVDGSHSMKAAGIHRQLAMVRAYLAHVPRARFEVVIYRRFARRLVGAFARAGTFRAQVRTARKRGLFAPGNGSHLDRGLALAAKVLRGRTGTRRIVTFTDSLLRLSWTNRLAHRALALAPQGTITHVVVPHREDSYGESVTEKRDDNHRLSPVAGKHGGVLLRIGLQAQPSHNKLMPVMLGLVRPIRIDNVRVVGLPKDHELRMPATLAEGVGVREMVELEKAPRRLTVVGRIWAQPFRKVIRVDPGFTRATAAFVFSHNLHGGLTNPQMLRVAKLGRAVSPVTSYLAIEPGVRPSWAGLAEDALGHLIGNTVGDISGLGGLGLAGSSPTPTFKPFMKSIVKRCVARHQPTPGWSVTLRTLTTYDEVVDVIPSGPSSAFRRCLVEGAWKVRLTSTFSEQYDAFDFTLSQK